MDNTPFSSNTSRPLVTITGTRNGYIQLAPAQPITQYGQLPPALFTAAQAWAAILEEHGAKRVYWITLSEAVTHLHIHLYPRWSDTEAKGVPLFEDRNTAGQPPWTPPLDAALSEWAILHNVERLHP